MRTRVTSDSGNSVSLFPFLAVLLCTMGALLVLLVVLAQRAGERVVAEADTSTVVPANIELASPLDSSATEKLVEQLEKVKQYQQRLDELQKQADQRLLEEKQRLTHVEEHTRRLEHELARLSLAAEQLKATEQDQSVDQAQAEGELERLKKLIEDTEARLEELREQDQGRRSYAIVPYRGPNGTYRKPIYIECRKNAIILHPEGIHFKASDFIDPSWPGNPLAAAIRATRDHVNAQAARVGEAEPPDPYPMILVRPDGIRQYSLARAAIKSWDSSYGYEFIDSDWELNFPELPDPQLARVQEHAIMMARDRLARLIRSAPSRFGGRGLGGRGSGAGSGASGSNGFGDGSVDGVYADDSQLGRSQSGGNSVSNGFAGNSPGSENSMAADDGVASGELEYGAMADGAGSASGASGAGNLQTGAAESEVEANGSRNGGTSDQYSQAGGSGEAEAAAASGGSGSSGGKQSDAGQSSGVRTATAGGAASSGGSGNSAAGQKASIAETRGRNWAVQGGSPNSVAIRRPIQVVVRQDQLAMLPNRHAMAGDTSKGRLISLDQSTKAISDEFVSALRMRIEEWGLAGRGLYWRPVLQLNVAPGAQQTANQVLRLLKDSGVEVSLPETARVPSNNEGGGITDAPR